MTIIRQEPSTVRQPNVKLAMPRIVAFFACSVVCVAASLPAQADETAGVIERVDVGSRTVLLNDGTRYLLPTGLDSSTVHAGMVVHLIVARETSGAIDQIQS